LARSSAGGRRTSAGPSGRSRTPRPDPRADPVIESAPASSLASAMLPRVWQGVGYRPLPDAELAHPLFDFAAVPWPTNPGLELGWGAFDATTGAERLVGAFVAERDGPALFLHGPVVVSDAEPMEIAAQLLAAAIEHARAAGAETLFSRPQGLDRVWVRFGFIPVPEGALPPALAGRPGRGLYAWRGGTALWTFRESSAH
jgi:GNAT superfamily N-acetyltransferase